MESINYRTRIWCETHNVPSHFQSTVSSTNSWAKEKFKDTNVIAVFLTDDQTQGRGRGENTWTNAEPGNTLLSTWCLRVEETPQPIFAIRMGLALWETLQGVWPTIPWALKAPNDIYVGEGKFAGILIEVEEQLSAIAAFIGIGANIGSAPQGIDQKTFALASHPSANIEGSWSAFCNLIVKNLFELRKDAHRSLLTNREIERLSKALELYPQNQVKQILPDGSLILKNNDRLHWNEL